MTRLWPAAISLAALVLAQQGATAWAAPTVPVEVGTALPADAAAYVTRRMGCNHWMGEEAYDAERGREIAAAVRAQRCETLDADERRLRRRYGRDPAVLKALDRARDADG